MRVKGDLEHISGPLGDVMRGIEETVQHIAKPLAEIKAGESHVHEHALEAMQTLIQRFEEVTAENVRLREAVQEAADGVSCIGTLRPGIREHIVRCIERVLDSNATHAPVSRPVEGS